MAKATEPPNQIRISEKQFADLMEGKKPGVKVTEGEPGSAPGADEAKPKMSLGDALKALNRSTPKTNPKINSNKDVVAVINKQIANDTKNIDRMIKALDRLAGKTNPKINSNKDVVAVIDRQIANDTKNTDRMIKALAGIEASMEEQTNVFKESLLENKNNLEAGVLAPDSKIKEEEKKVEEEEEEKEPTFFEKILKPLLMIGVGAILRSFDDIKKYYDENIKGFVDKILELVGPGGALFLLGAGLVALLNPFTSISLAFAAIEAVVTAASSAIASAFAIPASIAAAATAAVAIPAAIAYAFDKAMTGGANKEILKISKGSSDDIAISLKKGTNPDFTYKELSKIAESDPTVAKKLNDAVQSLSPAEKEKAKIPEPGAPGSPKATTPPAPGDSQREGGDLTKTSEGFEPNIYPDTDGKPTIGYGHQLTPDENDSGIIKIDGKDVDIANGISEPDAAALLKQDQKKYSSEGMGNLEKLGVDTSKLGEGTKTALNDLAYNAGPGIFEQTPKLVEALKNNDLDAIEKEISNVGLTVKGTGDRPKGLANRVESRVDLIRSDAGTQLNKETQRADAPGSTAGKQLASDTKETQTASINPPTQAVAPVINNITTNNNNPAGQSSPGVINKPGADINPINQMWNTFAFA